MEGVPTHGWGVGLDIFEGPFQPKPFYDSMVLYSCINPGTVENLLTG